MRREVFDIPVRPTARGLAMVRGAVYDAAPWLISAGAAAVIVILLLFPVRVRATETERIIRQPELPAQPSVGDILTAFAPVIVRGRTRSCVDYGDLKTWRAVVCYVNSSPPQGGGRPAIDGN